MCDEMGTSSPRNIRSRYGPNGRPGHHRADVSALRLRHARRGRAARPKVWPSRRTQRRGHRRFSPRRTPPATPGAGSRTPGPSRTARLDSQPGRAGQPLTLRDSPATRCYCRFSLWCWNPKTADWHRYNAVFGLRTLHILAPPGGDGVRFSVSGLPAGVAPMASPGCGRCCRSQYAPGCLSTTSAVTS